MAALLLTLLMATGQALAVTVSSVDLWPTAACSGFASLDVAWTGATDAHYEFGSATDAAGTTIGTFGPLSQGADVHPPGIAPYRIDITTAQPANAVIGSYGWIGANPPASGTAAEFFVLYNCTTKVVLYRCTGAYGTCPATAKAAIALLPPAFSDPNAVPTLGPAALAGLTLLLAAAAGGTLVRRHVARPQRE